MGLDLRYGIADIDDCCNAARYAVAQGWADPKKLLIEGGSSGGYVVLCAVLRPLFAAAVSRFGISDWESMVATTHKFEARYFDNLIAPYPEGAELIRDRSPLTHINNIACPVAFFQGLDDKIVPPDQTSTIFKVVKEKGLATALVEFQG